MPRLEALSIADGLVAFIGFLIAYAMNDKDTEKRPRFEVIWDFPVRIEERRHARFYQATVSPLTRRNVPVSSMEKPAINPLIPETLSGISTVAPPTPMRVFT